MILNPYFDALMSPRWGNSFSRPWQDLCQELQLSVDEGRALREITTFFHFPPTPHGFLPATKSLLILIDLIAETGWNGDRLQRWKLLLKKAYRLIESGSLSTGSQNLVTDDDIRGLCTKYPIYVTWIRINGEPSTLNKAILLPIGFLSLCAYNQIGYPDKLTSYGLSIRKILINPGSGSLSFQLVGSQETPILIRLFQAMETYSQDRNQYVKINNQDFSKLDQYIVGSYIPKAPPSHHSKRGKGGIVGRFPLVATHMNFNFLSSYEQSDTLGNYETVGYLNKNLVNLLRGKEKAFAAIDPSDFETQINISVSSTALVKTKPTENRPQPPIANEVIPLKKKLNSTMIAQTLTKENQLIMSKTRVMDSFTLNAFIYEVIKLSESSLEHAKMYAAVLASMLFRGLSLDEAIKLSINENGIQLTNTLTLGNDHLLSAWHMPANLANINLNKNTFDTSETSRSEFNLPLNQWLHTLIKETIKERTLYEQNLLWVKNHKNAFFKDRLGYFGVENTFEEFYKTFFLQIRKKYSGIEINSSLVSQFLSRQALIDYDVVYSAYFTGSSTTHSRIPLHYVRLNVADVVEKYQQFWSKHTALLGQLIKESGLPHYQEEADKLHQWPPTTSQNEFIGSAAITKFEHFQTTVFVIKEQLERTLENRDWLNYHRWYAAYSLFLFTVGSGYRGVHDVLPSIRLVSPTGDFVAISDKDDSDMYHTRLVYLSSTIQQQILLYREHLEAFSQWVLNNHPTIYQQLINVLYDAEYVWDYKKDRNRFKSDSTQFPVFFDIDTKNNEVLQFSIVKLLKMLNQHTNLHIPSNAGRHLLRTKFVNVAIPTEIVDAFMGHQVYGMEAHHPNSAFCPSNLPTFLETPIQEVLTATGFEPVRSHITKAFK
ncbi:MAG: hypothetical protein IBX55_18080 [Methyloprofundus sp.]|nr:hypothetical protein [Methyloprofundus sp.]